MGFVMDGKKVEEKWKFCTRSLISQSLIKLKYSIEISDVYSTQTTVNEILN